MKQLFTGLFLLAFHFHVFAQNSVPQKPAIVRYHLFVKDTIVNYTGKNKKAIAINGSIPAPALYFTEGDTAEIYVHNEMDVETSVHWHGVFLPNRYDGVPYLTQMPIAPHSTFVYRFPVIQNGTYWYHSHTRLQEQSGMYGALIFNKKKEPEIPAIPLLISDWTDLKPMEVDRSLHNGTDWFAIQKGSTQSYSEAISSGYFKTKLNNEWKRMTAMDVSDVYYNRFLINGKPESEQTQFKAGEKVKLRIVNGGASTYFWLSYSGGKLTVVANDGNDVEPVEVDRLIIAPSETYDIIVSIPGNGSYQFLATAEDRTRSASVWLGAGDKIAARVPERLKYFEGMKMMNGMMKLNGKMDPMGMEMSNQQMDMNMVMYPEAEENPVTLNYSKLKATEKTTLRPGPERILRFELTGNMTRYVWSLNNKTVSESDQILISKGENVKIILYNNSMMRHPMHLHGHDFRVINGQGEYAPLKNVIDIMPMESDTIEFAATESGDWIFHCHILYHMMSGMGRVFSYQNSPPNPEINKPAYAQRKLFSDDRMPHLMVMAGMQNNGSDGEAMLANTRFKLQTEWAIGMNKHHGYESETLFGRYLGRMQWLFPYIGFDYHYRLMDEMAMIEDKRTLLGQKNTAENRQVLMVGLQYTLPMLFTADARMDSKGTLLVELRREDIPVTPRLRLSMMANSDREYMGGFRYIIGKYISLSSHYDSDMGAGAGIMLTY